MPTKKQMNDLWNFEMWMNQEQARINTKPLPIEPAAPALQMFKVDMSGIEYRIYKNDMLPEKSAILSPDMYKILKKYFEDKAAQ